MIVALAGNPNSGKTTLFNELTGGTQYAGNWPGVTVEKKEGKLKGHFGITVVDLPGIYSLSPYTLEERISRSFLLEEKPDVVLNIVDASNLRRNLYLTLQILEMGVPVIVALNMMDIVEKRGEFVDAALLSKRLKCPVVGICAAKGVGIEDLTSLLLRSDGKEEIPKPLIYGEVSGWVLRIKDAVKGFAEGGRQEWHCLKLLERDREAAKQLPQGAQERTDDIVREFERQKGADAESFFTELRYTYISRLLDGVCRASRKGGNSVSQKLDKVLTGRFTALPLFILIIWGVYFVSIQLAGNLTIDFLERFISDAAGGTVRNLLDKMGAAAWLKGFVVDGLIGGVGAVLVFVPQLMSLFLLLSFLEDSGYMARVAFILDRIFKKLGLSGKSAIPMIIGTGCSVPAIMAARTIEGERERRMTIMLTPFIPCGAKLPVFAFIAGAMFPQHTFAAPSMYLLGIAVAIISGLLLKRTEVFKGESPPFVMELPDYKLPKFKGLMIHMWERSKDFLKKAGTIIFAASGIIWLLSSFDFSFQMAEAERSMLASLGRLIAPVFVPLGFGNWQSAVALLSGTVAKENIVAAFGIILGLGEGHPLISQQLEKLFVNPAAAYAFMTFILLSPPCFAALGAMKRELGGLKWMLGAMAFQFMAAYFAAAMLYHLGSLLFFGAPLFPSLLTILCLPLTMYLFYLIMRRPDIKTQKKPTSVQSPYCQTCHKTCPDCPASSKK